MSSNKKAIPDETQVIATFTSTVQRYGQVNMIVNNAGLMLFKPLEEQAFAIG